MEGSCRRRILSLLVVVTACLSLFQFHSFVHAEGEGQQVYIIPVKETVERGMAAFLERTTKEAVENGADHIIFEIDT
ncbi:hypothetical protein LD39_20795, partial [Halobacillus sp. BBL2006]